MLSTIRNERLAEERMARGSQKAVYWLHGLATEAAHMQ